MGLLQDYQTEHPNIENFNNEAIANIASIYNTENMKISNINVTKNLNVNGVTTMKGRIAVGGVTTTPQSVDYIKIGPNTNNYLYYNNDTGLWKLGRYDTTAPGNAGMIHIESPVTFMKNTSVNGLGLSWEDNRSIARTPKFYTDKGPGIYNEYSLERLTGGVGDGGVTVSTQVFWHDVSVTNAVIQYIYTGGRVFIRNGINNNTWSRRSQLALIEKTDDTNPDGLQHLVIRKPNTDFHECAGNKDIFVDSNVPDFEDCIRRCKNDGRSLGHTYKYAIYGKQGALSNSDIGKCWCRHSCWGHRKLVGYDSAVII